MVNWPIYLEFPNTVHHKSAKKLLGKKAGGCSSNCDFVTEGSLPIFAAIPIFVQFHTHYYHHPKTICTTQLGGIILIINVGV